MFNLDNVKTLHLELTTVCNAACPQCARESNLYDDSSDRNELTLANVQEFFSIEFVQQLDKVYACGNFGDPAAAKECYDILSWFRSVNPLITLGINTNGSIRTTEWWIELGKLLSSEKDYAVFSIDGLADTNHIYRVNTVWDRIIENATAFISAGGRAHWDMLVYEHNEHQVEQAKQLAEQLKFKWFRSKVSRRFEVQPVEFLKLPKDFRTPEFVITDTVNCHVLNEKSVYVAANGNVFPCCFIGAEVFSPSTELTNFIDLSSTNLHTTSLPNIIEQFNTFSKDWEYSTCRKTCSVYKLTTPFTDQWRSEVEFK